MSSHPFERYVKKILKEKCSIDIPDAIIEQNDLISRFKYFSFENPEIGNQDKFLISLISNKNYFEFSNILKQNQNINSVLKSSQIFAQLARFFLSVILNMYYDKDQLMDSESLIYCLLYSKQQIILDILNDFLPILINKFKKDTNVTFLPNCQCLFDGIIGFYTNPMNMSQNLYKSVFLIGSNILSSSLAHNYVAKADQYFNYLYVSYEYLPSNEKCCIDSVLLYADYISKNYNFSIKDKVCSHCKFDSATLTDYYITDNLITEGPYIEEKLLNSENQLSKIVPKHFSKIKPILNAAQFFFQSSAEFSKELSKRIAGDATYFWRFFFAALMLYFKDDPTYINSIKLNSFTQLFDLRLIVDDIHPNNDIPQTVNSVLVTIAVKAQLIEPSLRLLASNCPYEALQGVDIFYGMLFQQKNWLTDGSNAYVILSNLANLFVRTKDAYIKNELTKNDKDSQILFRIRSSILHIFNNLSSKKYNIYESEGFADIIYPFFFEEKPKDIALHILKQWSNPKPSVSFYRGMLTYFLKFIEPIDTEHTHELFQVFNEIFQIFLTTIDNADIDTISQVSFASVFSKLVDKNMVEFATGVLNYCVLEPNFRDVEKVYIYLDEFFIKKQPFEELLKLTEKNSRFNSAVFYPAKLLDKILLLKQQDYSYTMINFTYKNSSYFNIDQNLQKSYDLTSWDSSASSSLPHFNNDWLSHPSQKHKSKASYYQDTPKKKHLEKFYNKSPPPIFHNSKFGDVSSSDFNESETSSFTGKKISFNSVHRDQIITPPNNENESPYDKIVADLYANIAINHYTVDDAKKLVTSPLFDLAYNSTAKKIHFPFPPSYDSLTKLHTRKRIQTDSFENFICYIRFDKTVLSSKITFLRFSILEHDIEIRSDKSKIYLALILRNNRQNLYDTPLTITPLEWIRFKISIYDRSLILKVGQQQTFSLTFPGQFSFKIDIENILSNYAGLIDTSFYISFFPVSIDVYLNSSSYTSSNFLNSFSDISIIPSLDFMTALVFTDPLYSEYYFQLKNYFINSEKYKYEEDIKLECIKRLIPNNVSALFLFDKDILLSFSKQKRKEILRYYNESFTKDDWIEISKTFPISTLILTIQKVLFPNNQTNDEDEIFPESLKNDLENDENVSFFWDSFFIIASHLFNNEVFKLIINYMILRTNSYFTFFEKCCMEIPQFVSSLTENNIKKIIFIMTQDKSEEISLKTVKLFHFISCLALKPIQLPTFYLFDLIQNPFRDKILNETIDLMKENLDKTTCLIPNLIPIFSILADNEKVKENRQFIKNYANYLINCPNWVYWLMTLAALDSDSVTEWATIFSEACRGKDMFQVTIWLTFLVKISPFFNIDRDLFLGSTFRCLLSFPQTPETFTYLFRFLMYDIKKTTYYPPLEVPKQIALDIKPIESFDLLNRSKTFALLASNASAIALNIPPEIFAQGQTTNYSNLQIASLFSGLIADTLPQHAALLFEKAYSFAEERSEEEAKKCIISAGTQLMNNKSLKPLLISNTRNKKETQNSFIIKFKDMIDQKYETIKAQTSQAYPLIEFDKFCRMFAESEDQKLIDFVNNIIMDFKSKKL